MEKVPLEFKRIYSYCTIEKLEYFRKFAKNPETVSKFNQLIKERKKLIKNRK